VAGAARERFFQWRAEWADITDLPRAQHAIKLALVCRIDLFVDHATRPWPRCRARHEYRRRERGYRDEHIDAIAAEPRTVCAGTGQWLLPRFGSHRWGR
jgi:hypothetical protein